MPPDKAAASSRPIRRYGNRKLYDPQTRRYVTLEGLARLVADGREIEVTDQKTGEDLTGLTLVQVLLEGVKQGASRIPRQVLTRERILEDVWGFDFPTTANSLEVYVGYLRRKTEAEGEARLVHTVRGVGYVLRETPP